MKYKFSKQTGDAIELTANNNKSDGIDIGGGGSGIGDVCGKHNINNENASCVY